MESIEELLIKAKAKGTDKQFREWINRQPSCISGRFSEWVNGEGRCEAAHVRRAGKSGTSFKAEYAEVPLTRQEHETQSLHGESALFPGWTNEEAKDWFNAQRIKYLKLWIES